MKLTFEVLPDTYGICRMGTEETIPVWASRGGFYSITKTADELSVVCVDSDIPDDVLCERAWTAFKIQGILEFGLVGILSEVTTALAKAGLGIFAISTYNTDYILVQEKDYDCAITALSDAGHEIIGRIV
jgi:hypothetical protein